MNATKEKQRPVKFFFTFLPNTLGQSAERTVVVPHSRSFNFHNQFFLVQQETELAKNFVETMGTGKMEVIPRWKLKVTSQQASNGSIQKLKRIFQFTLFS